MVSQKLLIAPRLANPYVRHGRDIRKIQLVRPFQCSLAHHFLLPFVRLPGLYNNLGSSHIQPTLDTETAKAVLG